MKQTKQSQHTGLWDATQDHGVALHPLILQLAHVLGALAHECTLLVL